MRNVKSIRLDSAVCDWFIMNGANLNGTINRLMCRLVQRCQHDEAFANRVRRHGKDIYYSIGG